MSRIVQANRKDLVSQINTLYNHIEMTCIPKMHCTVNLLVKIIRLISRQSRTGIWGYTGTESLKSTQIKTGQLSPGTFLNWYNGCSGDIFTWLMETQDPRFSFSSLFPVLFFVAVKPSPSGASSSCAIFKQLASCAAFVCVVRHHQEMTAVLEEDRQ